MSIPALEEYYPAAEWDVREETDPARVQSLCGSKIRACHEQAPIGNTGYCLLARPKPPGDEKPLVIVCKQELVPTNDKINVPFELPPGFRVIDVRPYLPPRLKNALGLLPKTGGPPFYWCDDSVASGPEHPDAAGGYADNLQMVLPGPGKKWVIPLRVSQYRLFLLERSETTTETPKTWDTLSEAERKQLLHHLRRAALCRARQWDEELAMEAILGREIGISEHIEDCAAGVHEATDYGADFISMEDLKTILDDE
jgi:hypothetical protein